MDTRIGTLALPVSNVIPAPAMPVDAGGLARQKPWLLFAFEAVFLLRFADRRFRGLLFQEPPRTTRRAHARGPAQPKPNRASSRLRKPSESPCIAWPTHALTQR